MTSCPTSTGPPLELSLDPETLLDARRTLLSQELALDRVRARPPDTGVTTGLTARTFDRVDAAVDAMAADLHELADGLRRYVDDLVDQDGRVTLMFDLLRMRGLA